VTTATLDPVTLEVVKNALGSVADEMALVLMRSAYSPVVRDTMDYSTALCDADGEVVAQGLTLAVQLGTFPLVMRHVREHFAGDVHEGDVFVANDPYGFGGQHLPDIYVIEPIFHAGALEGWAATMAHHVDVGGIAPGSIAVHATEIFQEGLRLPLLKLVEGGRENTPVLRILEKNTRQPVEVIGDLRAQIAACHAGVRGYGDLLRRHGAGELRRYVDELQSLSERLMRAEIAALPDGRYAFEDWIDGVGEQPEALRIAVEVRIEGDEATVDFAGTAPQVAASVNCPVGLIHAAVYCAFRGIATREIPNAGGYMRPIHVAAPQGTIVNPVLPAACGARGVVGYRVYDALMGAFAQIVPDRVVLPGEGGPSLVMIGGYQDGKPFVLAEVIVGCWGARAGRDGLEGVSNPLANLSNQPVEMVESELPLRVHRYGLVPDSGGRGRFRGGLAYERAYELLADEAVLTVRSDRRDHRPWGYAGGEAGAPSSNVVRSADGTERVLPTMPMQAVTLRRGDVFHHVSAGGGGYGDPAERDPELVRQDVLDGKVTG
jgi:N-methylhydantoinase B